MTDWIENVEKKEDRRKKSISVFAPNTLEKRRAFGRWKSDSCSNKINGRLMIYQHQNRQTEEAFKCLTLTHNIFSGVKNNNNECRRKEEEEEKTTAKRTKYVDIHIFQNIGSEKRWKITIITNTSCRSIYNRIFCFCFSCPHIVEICLFLVAQALEL